MHNPHDTHSGPEALARQITADEIDLRPCLGVAEVSALLGLPEATLYRWYLSPTDHELQGPRAVRVGRHLIYALSEIRSYIESGRHARV